jgi:hypothetical protein
MVNCEHYMLARTSIVACCGRILPASFRELGHKEVLSALVFGKRKAFLAAVGRIHAGIVNVVIRHVVTFHPSAEISVRYVVLGLGTPARSSRTRCNWGGRSACPTLLYGPVRPRGSLRRLGGRRRSPAGRQSRRWRLRGSLHTVRNSSAHSTGVSLESRRACSTSLIQNTEVTGGGRGI